MQQPSLSYFDCIERFGTPQACLQKIARHAGSKALSVHVVAMTGRICSAATGCTGDPLSPSGLDYRWHGLSPCSSAAAERVCRDLLDECRPRRDFGVALVEAARRELA